MQRRAHISAVDSKLRFSLEINDFIRIKSHGEQNTIINGALRNIASLLFLCRHITPRLAKLTLFFQISTIVVKGSWTPQLLKLII